MTCDIYIPAVRETVVCECVCKPISHRRQLLVHGGCREYLSMVNCSIIFTVTDEFGPPSKKKVNFVSELYLET